MIDQSLQALMKQVAETANFHSLFDRFSDDVELRMTMAVTLSTCKGQRGRESVIRHLQNAGDADGPRVNEPIEVFADSERFVVCHDASVAIAAGLNVRCERTLVFDVHEGLVTRIAIHHELLPAVSRAGLPFAEAMAEA